MTKDLAIRKDLRLTPGRLLAIIALVFVLEVGWELGQHLWLMKVPMWEMHVVSAAVGIALALIVVWIAAHALLDLHRERERTERLAQTLARASLAEVTYLDPMGSFVGSAQLVEKTLKSEADSGLRALLEDMVRRAREVEAFVKELRTTLAGAREG